MSEDVERIYGVPPNRGINLALHNLTANKVSTLQIFTRLTCIIFTILHILYSSNHHSYYHKALLANAATSALRLHQRLPTVRFNTQFLGELLIEDSCHYLLYSMAFLYASPITLCLFPISLFAFQHILQALFSIIDDCGLRYRYGEFIFFMIGSSPYLYQSIALAEIFLFPIMIFSMFLGLVSIVEMFFYYHFLRLRYASQRNPYSRHTFRQLKTTTLNFICQPRFPTFIRSGVLTIIQLIETLCPPIER